MASIPAVADSMALPEIDRTTLDKMGVRLIDDPSDTNEAVKDELTYGDALVAHGHTFYLSSSDSAQNRRTVGKAIQENARLWGDVVAFRDRDGLHLIATEGVDHDLNEKVPAFDARLAKAKIKALPEPTRQNELTEYLRMLEAAREELKIRAAVLDMLYDHSFVFSETDGINNPINSDQEWQAISVLEDKADQNRNGELEAEEESPLWDNGDIPESCVQDFIKARNHYVDMVEYMTAALADDTAAVTQ